MGYYSHYIMIRVGKLVEAKKFLTDFFRTDNGEYDLCHEGWEIQKANEGNLLDMLSHGPVIKVQCSDYIFDKVYTYLKNMEIAA